MKEVLMRLTLNFEPSERVFETPVEDFVVGFVQKMLGDGNKWHNSFSAYNISTMQGWDIKDGKIYFPKGGYFHISSIDMEFMKTITDNLLKCYDTAVLRDMKLKNFSFTADSIHSDYDIVKTISPILLKTKDNRIVTFKDDDFIRLLTEQCKAKLLHNGFNESDVRDFEIQPFHFEDAVVKYTKRKNYSLPASRVMLVIKGKPKCRKVLYEMGIGSSTGYCYGTVEIMKIHIDNIN